MEIKVKPRAGIKVRLEDGTGFVAETGQTVFQTAYYTRRIADGDLIVLTDEEEDK
uniref:DUF2635 domain-containing protein n=1 Tax=Siphoviridae sp. ctLeG9 TaxID=2827848 RepID=A0A8S5RUP7_9CAUD|nr:MAG TPA: Protein of unknown function (DUF2635) [Siphoviridae sp. ctLeG9]